MEITTKFNLADIVYLKLDVHQGNMVPLIVEKITTTVETTEIISTLYQISNTEKFHNENAYEQDLYTYAEAQSIALAALNDEKAEIQYKIDHL